MDSENERKRHSKALATVVGYTVVMEGVLHYWLGFSRTMTLFFVFFGIIFIPTAIGAAALVTTGAYRCMTSVYRCATGATND